MKEKAKTHNFFGGVNDICILNLEIYLAAEMD